MLHVIKPSEAKKKALEQDVGAQRVYKGQANSPGYCL